MSWFGICESFYWEGTIGWPSLSSEADPWCAIIYGLFFLLHLLISEKEKEEAWFSNYCHLFLSYVFSVPWSRLCEIGESCTGMHSKFLNHLQSGTMDRISQLDIKCWLLWLLHTIVLFWINLTAFRAQGHIRPFSWNAHKFTHYLLKFLSHAWNKK